MANWLIPSLCALLLYGLGQGLVKKWIAEVPPARFCLYFVAAKSLVNLVYFFTQDHPAFLAPGGLSFIGLGVFSYVLDGIGWILYFQSIIAGPITIVGTLSAAYPSLTVLFAGVFLNEALSLSQYAGVLAVILGCMGLAYQSTPQTKQTLAIRWVPLALSALVLWSVSQTLVKYAYSLPGAHDATLAVANTIGGALTLGIYGFWKGRDVDADSRQWLRSLLPMGMMAGGDLGVIIANRFGPISIVTPLTGAYPIVTLGFAAWVLREKISRIQWLSVCLVLFGMYAATVFNSGGSS